MHTSFEFTFVLGIVLLIIGVSTLINKKSMAMVVEEVAKDRGALWIYGFIDLMVGLIFITLGQFGIIAFIGWLGILKGAYLLLFPESAAAMYRKINKPSTFAFIGILTILLGLFFVL